MKIMKSVICAGLALSVLFMSSCVKYASFDELAGEHKTTEYSYNSENTTSIVIENSTAVSENVSIQPSVPSEITTVYIPTTQAAEVTTEPVLTARPVDENTTAEIPQEENTTAEENTSDTNEDYSAYSVEEIIALYSDALNRTRDYKGTLNVSHSESFTAEVVRAEPDNALVKRLANYVVNLVGSEGSQELVFNNGSAVNSDGETIPVLLPQRTGFNLSADGVAFASAEKVNDAVRVKLRLVPETVSMGQVPTHNASAIGYLDTSDISVPVVTMHQVDITYPGSEIDAYITSDGYIKSVTYTINMSTYAVLSGMGMSGSGVLEGAQTEKWVINR